MIGVVVTEADLRLLILLAVLRVVSALKRLPNEREWERSKTRLDAAIAAADAGGGETRAGD
jgi:hypothetical protein